MKIPILTLKETLDSLLGWVSDNYLYYKELNTPELSWIYLTFNENIHGNFNFYAQLVSIITRTSKHSRKLETRLMFDNTRANLPTIHIHMPGEAKGSYDSLNAQTGIGGVDEENNAYVKLARSSTSTYELIITGSGSEEVIAIYELLQGLFIAGHDTLQNVFEVFDYSGAELMANPDLIPYNTFFRAFRVTVKYERTVRPIVLNPTISNIYLWGEVVQEEESTPGEEPSPYPPASTDWLISGLKGSDDGGLIPQVQFDWLGAVVTSIASFITKLTDKLYLHISDTDNPHNTTAAQVGAAEEAPKDNFQYGRKGGGWEKISTEPSVSTAYSHSQVTTGNPHGTTANEVGADIAGAAGQALIDAKSYADGIIVGALIDCGNWDAHNNTYPTTGGTGTGGAIKKGNLWFISVVGILQGHQLHVGDTIRALADTPGQVDANWAIIEDDMGDNPEFANVNITNLTTDATPGGVIPAAEATWLGATAKSVLSYIANISSKLYYSIYPQPQATSETGTFQLALTHLEIVTRVNSATDCLCNIPLNDTVAFPIGSVITIEQLGAGIITATAISGVTLNGDPKTQGQYKFIQLWKTAINTWVVIGGTT